MRMNTRRPIAILAAAAALLALPVYSVFGGSDDPNPPGQFQVSNQTALTDNFTYQGRLTESNQPANGTYDFQFTLYGAASGSAQVCTVVANDVETRDDVTVANGVFTVDLDFCPEAFDGDARWLEIAVRNGTATGVYTVLSPRQPISPTPYALHAKRAGALELPFVAEDSTTGETAVFEVEQTATTNAGPAIEIDGAIKVSGNKSAFNVLVTASTVCDPNGAADGTVDFGVMVPDDIANDESDLLFVTINGDTNGSPVNVAVAFDTDPDCGDGWVIYSTDGTAIDDDYWFNVLVIKQEVIE